MKKTLWMPIVGCLILSIIFIAYLLPYWWPYWADNREDLNSLFLTTGALIGIPFFIWREVSMHRSAKAATQQASTAFERHIEQTKADNERRITDSFTKAVEMLGRSELEVRLGAIYALKRIAESSQSDRQAILDIISAFVRNSAKLSTGSGIAVLNEAPDAERIMSPSIDVAAALTILTKNKLHDQNSEFQIDLSESSINKANLVGGDLTKFDFTGASLISANMSHSSLRGAKLVKSNLTNADLRNADLSGADLSDAILKGADLRNANLTNAKLLNTNFCKANMIALDPGRSEVNEIIHVADEFFATAFSQAVLCKTVMSDGRVVDVDCWQFYGDNNVPPDEYPNDKALIKWREKLKKKEIKSG